LGLSNLQIIYLYPRVCECVCAALPNQNWISQYWIPSTTWRWCSAASSESEGKHCFCTAQLKAKSLGQFSSVGLLWSQLITPAI